jgi:hypothetical protein
VVLEDERPPAIAYSETPKSKPHLRVVHIPYQDSHLKDLQHELIILPKGVKIIDWALKLGGPDEWLFVIDTSKDELDELCVFVHNDAFDFRTMMRSGGTNQSTAP